MSSILPLYLKLCPWEKVQASHPQANQNGQGAGYVQKKKKRNRKGAWYNLPCALMEIAKHL